MQIRQFPKPHRRDRRRRQESARRHVYGKDGTVRIAFLSRTLAALALIAVAGGIAPAEAQLNTQHVKGTAGLKSGSQPPPHSYVILPLLYLYNTDTVKDGQGEPFGVSTDLTSVAFAAGFVKVTTKKIIGGFYSY